MVKYQVKIAKEAKQSLKEFYNWLQENESELVASKVKDGLLQSIEALSERPERNGLLKEMARSEIEYRRVLKWSYKVVFIIEEQAKEVKVVDIVHSRRSPKYIQKKLGG